jgi:uncharacterized protein (TIGR02001 family)
MKGTIMFKKALSVAAIAAAVSMPGIVFAQTAPAPDKPADAKPEEPKPSYTLTGNFGVFSQYIFRGLTQTDRKPAAQGGFDWAHESGFYLGTWLSNISWPKENASVNGGGVIPNLITGTYESGGSLEWDFYGGYKWSLPKDFVIDFGTLYYYYPGNTSNFYNLVTSAAMAPVPFQGAPKLDTWEVYIAPSWKWFTVKYSYSVLDHTFGTLNSKGTGYLDVSANVPLGDYMKDLNGLTLNLHWGWQKYKGTDPRNVLFRGAYGGAVPDNDTILTYKDAKVGLTYALPKDFSIGAYWSKGFSYNKLGYGGVGDPAGPPGFFGPYPRDIASSTGTVFIQKTF